MNIQRVIKELKQKYPDKAIIKNPEDNPTEILCEIEPTADHSEYSVAIAVADKSTPHYHKHSIETYEVLRGKLYVFKNGQQFIVQKGDKIIIEPDIVHYVQAHETWFTVYSKPGWTLADHILVT